MSDRLSININNGQSDIFEAVTVRRDADPVYQSGLVGITDKMHSASNPPVLPETIFNVQSSGESNIRFSSLSRKRSNIEILGNGNMRSSGLHISYNSAFDDSSIGNTFSSVGLSDQPIIDFSQIEPSGTQGVEVGFLSATELGKVGIGRTKTRSGSSDTRHFSIVEPLTICNANTASSGTIAIKEQASKPTTTADFGKIYVTPTGLPAQSQALFFLDDAGNSHQLTKGETDAESGELYGDDHCNTYAGWNSPQDRTESASRKSNSFYGGGAGNKFSTGESNTFIGCSVGSGLETGDNNTVIGAHSFTHNSASVGNVILGANNLRLSNLSETTTRVVSNCVLLGTELFYDESPSQYTLAIGRGATPLITGLLFGTQRRFSVQSPASQPTTFAIDSSEFDAHIRTTIEKSRSVTIFGTKDNVSTVGHRGTIDFRFLNKNNTHQTLVTFDPSGTTPCTSASFTEPTYHTPFLGVSGDIRILGDIRFCDGTTMSTNPRNTYIATTGITRSTLGENYVFQLNFNNTLQLSSTLTPTGINTADSYIAMEVPSGTSRRMGKISLEGIGAYVTSGTAVIADNCNTKFTNPDNVLDTANNSNTVFIGCDVATQATGWKHSIFIGTQAGLQATIPNNSLATDTACTFIGYQAGYQAINTQNAVFLGTSAGKNADSSNGSIFIGNGAGENSTNPNSIGIGDHALGGELSKAEGGSKNIEIVAGLNDNQRLLHTSGTLSSRLNIQNVLAGDTLYRMLSVGDARLSPEAPLEVRRTTIKDQPHTSDRVQAWYNNDIRIGRVDPSGDFIKKDEANTESWFGSYEGFMTEYLYGPSSFTSPTSGLMRVKSYANGFGDDRLIMVTNRDIKLDIHGPGAVGGAAYIVTMKVNGENRPVYVSCSGN